MSFTTKLATGVMLAAATSTALTGCGKKGNDSAANKSLSSSEIKKIEKEPCTNKKAVSAAIGGEHKCLIPNQACSVANKGDYDNYGFKCIQDKKQGRYELAKK
ncbi:hypothetical protein Back2_04360 [Nocardioides baekrokdamisoli]|uniref:Lipoprotein n=1 Tax=Nocardioides baekrokdamisoli TaxID=1804624 RepID=A0A3G9IZM2_9ACTN|nr:hypothetical protein [Nocardioides baekrokdamisoli]BBH16149.1 hypothetical protein Back2_04360 [Nocardioides baekrokdamisoli]